MAEGGGGSGCVSGWEVEVPQKGRVGDPAMRHWHAKILYARVTGRQLGGGEGWRERVPARLGGGEG